MMPPVSSPLTARLQLATSLFDLVENKDTREQITAYFFFFFFRIYSFCASSHCRFSFADIFISFRLS